MMETLPSRGFTPLKRMGRLGVFGKRRRVGQNLFDGLYKSSFKLVVVVWNLERGLLR
jgi:hypothetical protein